MIKEMMFLTCLVALSTALAVNGEEPINGACAEPTGRVVYPADADYGKARLVSNYYPSKNSYPKAIVYCQNTQDVQNAIKWARCRNIPIRVRSGGHNHEGFSTGTDVVVIDVSEMKKIQIDKSQSVATVQPGITGGPLYNQLFKEGFTQVGGTCEDVGISGFMLSGGMGPLAHKYGLGCDNLISLEMVDANGEIIRATKDNEHKDLFWASRGGGAGNFGVVTSLEIKVHPAERVTWFNIGWDWSQPVEAIISKWQEFFLTGDKKWFAHLDLWAKPFPSKKFNKQPIKALGIYYGPPEEARRGLASLLSVGKPSEVTIELVDWNRAIQLFEDSTSTFISDKPEYKSSGAFAKKALSPEAVKILVKALNDSPSPLLNVLFLSLGGAVQDKSPTDTAFFYRNAPFFASYSTQWMQANDAAKQISEVDALRQNLLPYTEGDYIGNPDRNLKDYLTAYYGGNVERLRCIKRKYDPQNIFHYEQSVPPASENGVCN